MKINIGFKEILRFIPLLHNLATLKREDDAGLLYRMNYTGDYYALLPVLEGFFHAGCTVFTHTSPAGERLLGRNYDLRHNYTDPVTGKTEVTGLITVLRCQNRAAKYRSIGLCDAVYLDPSGKLFHRGTFDRKDKNTLRALLLPFLTMDGVNEKGLAVSILYLNTDNSFEEIEYRAPETFPEAEQANLILLETPGERPDKSNGRLHKSNLILNTADRRAWKVIKAKSTCQTEPGKRSVMHTVLMRQMLDTCQSCEEAIALARTVNMVSLPESDYHILVTDKERSFMLEWIDNRLTVEECTHAANFYHNRPDHFGYGYNRDEALAAAIKSHPAGITEEECMAAMREASQNFLTGKDRSYTQWSAVYNLPWQTLKVCVHSDYSRVFSFSLDEKKR